jgi:hypothetical protein
MTTELMLRAMCVALNSAIERATDGASLAIKMQEPMLSIADKIASTAGAIRFARGT